MSEMGGRKWPEVLSELTEEHEDKFLEIKKQDILGFCLENNMLRNVVDDYLKSVKVTRKDSVVALQKNEEGNKKFVQKNYEASLQSYTESISSASKNDEILPVAYANRSLVLEQMGHLSECLADIGMALALGYPRHKAQKLRSKCLLNLKKTKEFSQSGSNKKYGIPEYHLPKLAGGENKDFVSASANLSVHYDETKGRHVVANKDIHVGDVLFVERAFAFVVCTQACNHCLEKTVAPIPCEGCMDVTYCSSKCRDDSWKSVHCFQCGFGELFKSVGIADLGFKIILEASSSLDELKKKLTSISESKYKNGCVSVKSKGYGSVYNLVHHSDKHEVNDLFQYTMTALLLATYLKNYTSYFPTKSGDEDLELLTSVILRHILQMICNGFAVIEAFVRGKKTSMVLSKAEHRIASAIYPSVSMMNHSCVPSIITGFHKNYVIIQAAKDIKKGEEVFNCYAADARRMKRALRQEILSKQYFFKCECQECVQTFDIQDKLTAFKCSVCKGPSIQKEESVLEAICSECGQKSEITKQLIVKNNNFYSLLKEAEILQRFDINTSLKKSLDAWWLGREIYYTFHKDLSYAGDMVARCLAGLKEFKRCISFLKCTNLSVEKRFGSLSLEFVEELNKILDIQLSYLSSFPGVPPHNVVLECLWTQRKCQKIVRIIDGSPYFEPGIDAGLEELREYYNIQID